MCGSLQGSILLPRQSTLLAPPTLQLESHSKGRLLSTQLMTSRPARGDLSYGVETQTRHTATSAVGLFCLKLWSPTYHTFAYDLGSLRQVRAGPVDVLSGFLSGPDPGVHGVLSLRDCSTKVIGKIFAEISASEFIMLNDHVHQILGISISEPQKP